MANQKSFLDQITEFILIYKFRWIILIGIVLLVIFFISIKNNMDNKYKQYGYTGFSDNIVYDEWTEEVVNKNQIDNYKEIQSAKYFINSKGNKVLVSDIEKQLDEYSKVQGQKMFISQENYDKVNQICTILFNDYFEINYSIEAIPDSPSFYLVHLRNYKLGSSNISDENFGSTSELRYLLKKMFKYRYTNSFTTN